MRLIPVLFLTSISLLRAADVVEVPWQQVCSASSGQILTASQTSGESAEGYCFRVTADAIEIRTQDNRVVKVARAAVAKLEMRRAPAHHLKALHKGVHKNVREGIETTFSELAPAGLIMVPGTLAWGAVALPFAALGDLFHSAEPRRQIKII